MFIPESKSPLADIKVIDFTHVLAGPACVYFLALLDAEVIEVESVSKGDAMRHRGGTNLARAVSGMSSSKANQTSLLIALDSATNLAVSSCSCYYRINVANIATKKPSFSNGGEYETI